MRITQKYYKLLYRALLLSTLVLTGNQLIIQFWLNKKSEEGLIINIAGRQRMLSQRINLLVLREIVPGANKELDSLLREWTVNHFGLLKTNKRLNYHAVFNNDEAKKLLAGLSDNIEVVKSLIKLPKNSLKIATINEQLDDYLATMDKAVFAISKKADKQLSTIIILELVLFAVSITMLVLETRFVLLPTIRNLKSTIDEKDRLLIEKKANTQWRHTEYLKSLYAISVSEYSSEKKIQHILDMMKRHFELPVGIVSRVENELYEVEYCTTNEHGIKPNDTYTVSSTVCDITLNHKTKNALFENRPIFYCANLDESCFTHHSALSTTPFKAYIGMAIYVNGKLYGTVSLASTSSKEAFEDEDILMFLQAEEAISYELLLIERRKLQEQNEELAFIVKSTDNAVIITDNKAKITWTNEAFSKVTGYQFREVAGKSPGSFLQGPETDDHAKAKMRKAIVEEKPTQVEIVNYHKNGTPFWTSIDLQPVFSQKGQLKKFIGIQYNITDQVNLRLENEQLAVVAKKTNNAIIILDTNGRVLWVNDGFINLTGYAFEEVVGITDGYLLLGPLSRKSDVERIKSAIKRGGSLQSEMLIYNKNGDPYWVSLDLQPIKNSVGKVERFVILESDITEKVNSQKNQLISEIRGEEKERNRISKEIHDSVAQMLVASRLLLSKLKEDSPIEVILRQRDVLDTLIGEMISETRVIINSLGVSLDDSKNFKEALIDLIEKSYRVFEGKIKLQWEGNEQFEDFIYAMNIFRIVQEALNNSIKYADASNIIIKVSNCDVFKASIEDDGKGFDPLEREVVRGSGLKSMKSRAANINLRFDIHSRLGKGTKICLEA